MSKHTVWVAVGKNGPLTAYCSVYPGDVQMRLDNDYPNWRHDLIKVQAATLTLDPVKPKKRPAKRRRPA